MSDPGADTPPSGTPAIATPYDLVKLLLATRSEIALLNERLRNLPAPSPVTPPAAYPWLDLALGALLGAAVMALLFGWLQ